MAAEAEKYKDFESALARLEEIGELAHSHLKQEQGIRGTDSEHEHNAKDAIGDALVYLCDYCSRRGWDIQEILSQTWEHVSKRDWQKNSKDGGADA